MVKSPTGAQKYGHPRQKAEICQRKQALTESVDDYVAAMQAAARKIDMPETYLADAVMQGLKSELHLHVLHSKAETIDDILEATWVSEVVFVPYTHRRNHG